MDDHTGVAHGRRWTEPRLQVDSLSQPDRREGDFAVGAAVSVRDADCPIDQIWLEMIEPV